MELVSSVLPLKLDLYIQSDAQDEYTGAIKKEWNYYTTVNCSAKGVISNATTTRTGDRQVLGNKYKYDQFVEIRTIEKINVRHKITNIRNQKGAFIWTELDYPTETPTVFEVVGMTPITDPFGTVIAYNTTAKRSENQQVGI